MRLKSVENWVQTEDGGCMAAEMSGGELVWGQVACAQSLPTICRKDGPTYAAALVLDPNEKLTAGVMFLTACMVGVVMSVVVSYRRSRMDALHQETREILTLIAPDRAMRSYSSTVDTSRVSLHDDDGSDTEEDPLNHPYSSV
jgi:hypothetical protein